jgi:hypothetical protein
VSKRVASVILYPGIFKSFLIPCKSIGYSLVFEVGEPKNYQVSL